jgi:hypothetical protein
MMDKTNKSTEKLYDRLCKYKQDSLRRTEEKKKKKEETEISKVSSVPKINKDKYYHKQKDNFFARLEKNRTASQCVQEEKNGSDTTNGRINVNRVSSTARIQPVLKTLSTSVKTSKSNATKSAVSTQIYTYRPKSGIFRHASQEKVPTRNVASSTSTSGFYDNSTSRSNLNRSQCLNDKEAEIFKELFLKKYGKPLN